MSDPATPSVTASSPKGDETEVAAPLSRGWPCHIFGQGWTAYVTEPAAKKIHAVDLKTGKMIVSTTLPYVPNQINGTQG